MLAVLAQAVDGVEPDFVFSVSWLSPIVGVFIPILVGIVAKLNTSSKLKAVLNLTLSAIAAYITHLIANQGNFTVEEFVSAFLLTWITSLASYLGFWKPSGAASAVQQATKNTGIG